MLARTAAYQRQAQHRPNRTETKQNKLAPSSSSLSRLVAILLLRHSAILRPLAQAPAPRRQPQEVHKRRELELGAMAGRSFPIRSPKEEESNAAVRGIIRRNPLPLRPPVNPTPCRTTPDPSKIDSQVLKSSRPGSIQFFCACAAVLARSNLSCFRKGVQI